MFCVVCQKQFKTKNAYKCHASSDAHKKEEEEYKKDIKSRIKKNTRTFVADFHSYISQTTKYTEVNQLYRKYLAKNRFRIEGTSLKSVEEVVAELSGRISVVREDNKTMVKCLNRFETVKSPFIFDPHGLDSTFDIRMVERHRSRAPRHFDNIFEK